MTDNHLNIGILGGGQLGRMLIQAVRKMEIEEPVRCIVWEPNEEGCALPLADEVITKPYNDKKALQKFIKKVHKVVLEFENIPVEIVGEIEKSGKLVAPSSKVLSVVQDRIAEKTFFDNNEIPCAPWYAVDSEESALEAVKELGHPLILKTARFGYDGKGQVRCDYDDNVVEKWEELGKVDCIAEKQIFFLAEASIIGARNEEGNTVFYDIAENFHENGILRDSVLPAKISDNAIEKAKEYVKKAIEDLNVVGLLALEMFVDGDVVLANEMAARPHNSGHWTMDGAKTCQFEQCIRAATGMPFGSCERTDDMIMNNILGSSIETYRDNDVKEKLAKQGCIIHDYNKTEIREGRKMGHANRIGKRVE